MRCRLADTLPKRTFLFPIGEVEGLQRRQRHSNPIITIKDLRWQVQRIFLHKAGQASLETMLPAITKRKILPLMDRLIKLGSPRQWLTTQLGLKLRVFQLVQRHPPRRMMFSKYLRNQLLEVSLIVVVT